MMLDGKVRYNRQILYKKAVIEWGVTYLHES